MEGQKTLGIKILLDQRMVIEMEEIKSQVITKNPPIEKESLLKMNLKKVSRLLSVLS